MQLSPPRILLCASTFFSKYACLSTIFSRTPHCLSDWLDNTPEFALKTFNTKKAQAIKDTKSCMLLHELRSTRQLLDTELMTKLAVTNTVHWNRGMSEMLQLETSASSPGQSVRVSGETCHDGFYDQNREHNVL